MNTDQLVHKLDSSKPNTAAFLPLFFDRADQCLMSMVKNIYLVRPEEHICGQQHFEKIFHESLNGVSVNEY